MDGEAITGLYASITARERVFVWSVDERKGLLKSEGDKRLKSTPKNGGV